MAAITAEKMKQELALHTETQNIRGVKIEEFIDSDYSRARDSTRSVTGFIIYVNNAPVSCKSRTQNMHHHHQVKQNMRMYQRFVQRFNLFEY